MGFYLGRGVIWVVGFNGCGLPGLVCFSGVTLHFLHFTYVLAVPGYMWWLKRVCLGWVAFVGFVVLYLCFGSTWVHVVIEKDLLRLI